MIDEEDFEPNSFKAWFDLFIDEVRKLGYRGRIDIDTFAANWTNGEAPEEVAKDFVEEMTA